MEDLQEMKQRRGYWNGKSVLVTGGAGFIGSHMTETLVKHSARVRVVDSLENGSLENISGCIDRVEFLKTDLREPRECEAACADIDVVLSLAAKVAGVAYNQVHPAEMFRTNTIIGLNTLEAARKCNVERFLVVSSACVYRRESSVPTSESEGFVDDPEPSNLGYGWSKRVLELQARMYAKEYGIKISIVRPYNTYGPRDHFDPDYGHVIPSLIRKAVEGQNPIVVWGNGRQSRSFVYVEDVVKAMLLAIERYPVADPLNLGNPEEVSMRDLALLIKSLSASKAELAFDESKPSGQPRRVPDISKTAEKLGFLASVPLKEGLKRTIDWYASEVRHAVPLQPVASSPERRR